MSESENTEGPIGLSILQYDNHSKSTTAYKDTYKRPRGYDMLGHLHKKGLNAYQPCRY